MHSVLYAQKKMPLEIARLTSTAGWLTYKKDM